jgi:hypothetical protein
VETAGYGVRVTALAPGEAVMQIVTADGVRDVALVKVAEQ